MNAHKERLESNLLELLQGFSELERQRVEFFKRY